MRYGVKLRMYLIGNAEKRTKILVKNKVFRSVGNNFFFQPRKIPDEPQLIKFGNNVTVASDVTFVTHDVIDKVLNNMKYNTKFGYYAAPIEIGNNVFIGCNVTILPNVKIGNNVIIAAGSIVSKDVKDNVIVAGNPAKEIGKFDAYVEHRKNINEALVYPKTENEIKYLWDRFNVQK